MLHEKRGDMSSDNPNQPNNQPDPHRDGEHPRSAGTENSQSDIQDVTSTSLDELLNSGIPNGQGVSNNTLIQALIPLIHQEFRQYYPDPEVAEQLRERAPEVYDAWLKTTKSSIDTDNYVRRQTVDNSYKMASRGQFLGIISVVAVLLLAGWCAYLDKPWLAGFLVAIDVVALAAVFAPSKEKSSSDKESA